MRVEGWANLLVEHILTADRPFKWGEHDCVLWVAEWVNKATGKDYAGNVRGAYDSERGAMEFMLGRGYRNAEAVADAHLNPIPVSLAKRGDILLNPNGTLGICAGRTGVFPSQDGPLTHATKLCLKAWSVE